MDSDQFLQFGKKLLDYTVKYVETIEERRPFPDVKPGYLRNLVPKEAPQTAERWEDVFADVERAIMPGVSHWHSPNFHAYYPIGNSYGSTLADLLCDAIACNGFSWASSPVCTELEVIVLDWLVKLYGLPEHFLSTSENMGGGVIQSSASEATYVALLAAKNKKQIEHKENIKDKVSEHEFNSKLVAYVSQEAHSCGERAALLGNVLCRKLPVDENFRLRGDVLKEAIAKDKAAGLIPFYVLATLGTTSICSFDNVSEIGPICREENVWLHIDAAYAGGAFICPELRQHLEGVEYSDSYCFNPHNWMLVHYDCAAFWIKNRQFIVDAFNVNRVFLQHDYQDIAPDYRHWQVPFGRRFRALKIWFVLRLYGTEHIQQYVRKHITLASEFESLMRNDDRFEIIGQVLMGLVCFRLKGSNELNKQLIKSINDEGLIYMVPAQIDDIFFIRFAVCAYNSESKHIQFAYETIVRNAKKLLLLEAESSPN